MQKTCYQWLCLFVWKSQMCINAYIYLANMHTSTDEICWKTNLCNYQITLYCFQFRYFFALQVRRDLLLGELHCSENTAALLASYIVQGTYIEAFLCFENALHISSMAYKLALTILKFYRNYKLFLLFDRTVNNRWSKILLPLLVTLQERLVTFLWMNIETFHIFLHSSLFLSDSKQLRCFRKSWNTIDSMCM